MIKKHDHTSFPKHDYFLFQEILTQEKKIFHVKVCPLLLFFFLPKPPFQVFSLADIFFLFFFHAKRFARSLSWPVCPFYVDPP